MLAKLRDNIEPKVCKLKQWNLHCKGKERNGERERKTEREKVSERGRERERERERERKMEN